MTTLASFFATHRIGMSRVFGLAAALVLVVSGSMWEHTFMDAVLFMTGAVLAGVATVGRLWCSFYIAGYKDGTLITVGPYSVSRNPLYFFSALGAVGVGFATETISFGILFGLWFWLFYPGVIDAEERKLLELHGARFLDYCTRVPRFFPRSRLLVEPESYAVRPDRFRAHLFDALWFVWALGLLEILEALHEYRVLPTLLTWY
jgi:protein-S-isoprenylcysteine O-methyltransferase Ste14